MTDKVFSRVNAPEGKRWLIISHAFNMDGRAASQTITDKIPYLLSAGIQPIVFSAITGSEDQRFAHKQFLPWGPAGFRFDFRHWVANRYGRGFLYKLTTRFVSIILSPFILLERLILGLSSQWSWAMPAFFHGLSMIRQGKVDVVYSTGGAWSAHLAGFWLKRVTGIFWIAEIHDPLVIRNNPSDNGEKSPKTRDARFRKYLEQKICESADLVWWFTDGALFYAKKRNSILNTDQGARGISMIPGANPPNDIQGAVKHSYSEYLNLCHFGSLAADRSLSQIMEHLSGLFQKYPQARDHIRIHAYGAPLDSLTKKLEEDLEFSDVLIAHGRLEKDPKSGLTGRERVAIKMQQADVLILLHGTDEWCAEYIPSKFYEYLWIQRPIWAITHRNEQLDKMLTDRSCYLSHSENPISIQETLEKIWLDWQSKNLLSPSYDPISVEDGVQDILNVVYGGGAVE